MKPTELTEYDYDNQAWVVDGRYQDCGHPQKGEIIPNPFDGTPQAWPGCDCYGRAHAGEPYRGE